MDAQAVEEAAAAAVEEEVEDEETRASGRSAGRPVGRSIGSDSGGHFVRRSSNTAQAHSPSLKSKLKHSDCIT